LAQSRLSAARERRKERKPSLLRALEMLLRYFGGTRSAKSRRFATTRPR